MLYSSAQNPSVSPWFFWMFSRYNNWYLKRHFHAIRQHKQYPPPEIPEDPPIFYLNHPSWWDPLIILRLIDQYFPNYTHYAPMEAEQLQEFGLFKKLGVFGVDTSSIAGARHFLQTSTVVLSRPRSALWITPQARFADARERPLAFHSGLGHLAHRESSGTLIPIGITYSFWTNRYPEVLLGFGEETTISNKPNKDASEWTKHLEQNLEQILDDLLVADQNRNEQFFQTILGGSSGVGGIYGAWLSIRNTLFPPDSSPNSSTHQQEDSS